MNTTSTDDTYEQLSAVVDALDRRFPDGKDIFMRVARLAEETGELASAVNHIEGTGIKREKYGEPDMENFVKEVQDVMRAAVGIAKHYGAEEMLKESIRKSYLKNINF